jgi:glycosyltransferase involved in cell wall biosynthesis
MIPKISIGLPVYNSEKTITKVLESIVNQSFVDFELIISDNSSSDGTSIICKEYAKNDKRITYVRQLLNIGASKNFKFVLDLSRSPYFTWWASDDTKSPNFLDINYKFLEDNLDYVASTCPTYFPGANLSAERMGCVPLDGAVHERVKKFLSIQHANGQFYSLIRSRPLKDCKYLDYDFFGQDWAIMLSLIVFGKTNVTTTGYVELSRNGVSNSGTLYRFYRRKIIHFFIPFSELSIIVLSIISKYPLSYKIIIFISIFKLNFKAALSSLKIEFLLLKTLVTNRI